MAFIALLLLAIATTVMQVGAIYNKGVTMKSVNQSGRVVVTDMKRTIAESQIFDVTDSFKTQDQRGGRLCTSIYSYIWNIGRSIDANNPQVNKYSGSDKPIRLARVLNDGKQYCSTTNGLVDIDQAKATELLSEGDLAVQDFHIVRATDNLASGMALYSIGITISNAEKEALNTVDNSCKPPSEDATYQNYCSVNEFVFTARAGSKGGQ